MYHYVWHEVADNIIEESKAILNGVEEKKKISRQMLLHQILITCLKLLHPFMPFVTEVIWESVQHEKAKNTGSLLMIEKWPEPGQ